jgi:hypothetical protein
MNMTSRARHQPKQSEIIKLKLDLSSDTYSVEKKGNMIISSQEEEDDDDDESPRVRSRKLIQLRFKKS